MDLAQKQLKELAELEKIEEGYLRNLSDFRSEICLMEEKRYKVHKDLQNYGTWGAGNQGIQELDEIAQSTDQGHDLIETNNDLNQNDEENPKQLSERKSDIDDTETFRDEQQGIKSQSSNYTNPDYADIKIKSKKLSIASVELNRVNDIFSDHLESKVDELIMDPYLDQAGIRANKIKNQNKFASVLNELENSMTQILEITQINQNFKEKVIEVTESTRVPLVYIAPEKSYRSLFKNYDKTYDEENNAALLKQRKYAFLNGSLFNDNLLATPTIIDFSEQLYRKYRVVQEQQLIAFGEFNSLFESFIKNESSADYVSSMLNCTQAENTHTSRISCLINISVLEGIFGLSCIQKSELICFRTTTSDGDSLYRIFIYALFEQAITRKNLIEIKMLILDIYKVFKDFTAKTKPPHRYGNVSLEFDHFFMVLHELLKSAENHDFLLAERILITAFNSNSSFNDTAQLYIRLLIEKLAIEQFESLTAQLSNINSNNTLGIGYASIKSISIFKSEAHKLTLQMLANTFNADILVYVIDGFYSNGASTLEYKFEKFTALPKNCEDETKSRKILVSLIYMMNCYYLAYDRDNEYIRNSKSVELASQLTISKIRDKLFICPECKIESLTIEIQNCEINFCYNCAITIIGKQVKERIINLHKDRFHGLEYYCRGFEIWPGANINELAFSSVFGENIGYMISRLHEGLCLCCLTFFGKDEILTISDCKCQYCKSCLLKNLTEATNGSIILNKFDEFLARVYLIEHHKCLCLKNFNIEASLALLKVDFSDKILESKERLEAYKQTYCMICATQIRMLEDIGTSNTRGICRIVTMEGDSFSPHGVTHLVCNRCIKKIKTENASPKILKCSICCEDHQINSRIFNQIFQSSCKCSIL